ncbi:RHS repeat domain-containing protein [Chryseobacterium elymi]|uniref:RHS repeat domain-containing protein n=1 Tax=Chryseobacterium elymi TaxID=395936 RepID=UPI0026D5CCFD
MKVKKVFGTETTDYLDGFQYVNSALKFFPTAEGYFNVETGKYVYNYIDHLGNTRLSYATNGAGIEIIEESNYYPFGLKHEGYNVLTGNPSYKYKYNGKELQETGMHDYGARFYMPDLGRWGVIDMKAEISRRWSPYTYAYNNPIRFVDPDGRQNYDVIIKGSQSQAALNELQKSVSSELTLNMDKNPIHKIIPMRNYREMLSN